MRLLDHTCATAAENLALDEALLELAERSADTDGPTATSFANLEVLRLWEPAEPLVVVGRSSQLAVEVDEAECARRGISILRRGSGGAAIVTGPGCLMYAVVLSYRQRPGLRSLDVAHRTVMETLRGALAAVVPGVQFQGTCDLTLDGCKFSGNSLRCRREHLLYHGTLLYDFPLELIAACLRSPPRQPNYRAGRGHRSFVANLPIGREQLRQLVIDAWQADRPYGPVPLELVEQLAREKFLDPTWTRGR
jgi:lipoate-protein ligase A